MSKKFDYTQFEEELESLLGIGIIEEWRAFGPGHYRVNGELDVWPRHKKYMVVDSWKSDTYENLSDLF